MNVWRASLSVRLGLSLRRSYFNDFLPVVSSRFGLSSSKVWRAPSHRVLQAVSDDKDPLMHSGAGKQRVFRSAEREGTKARKAGMGLGLAAGTANASGSENSSAAVDVHVNWRDRDIQGNEDTPLEVDLAVKAREAGFG
uniref:Uncharacterized protein n=1 Tax=Mycena chlorophos TaxID=658473 RepID=A0ABQ0L157_MYCCL|nr:predicted protein [Mycena chlorophos]